MLSYEYCPDCRSQAKTTEDGKCSCCGAPRQDQTAFNHIVYVCNCGWLKSRVGKTETYSVNRKDAMVFADWEDLNGFIFTNPNACRVVRVDKHGN